jgi:hypothetical protein
MVAAAVAILLLASGCLVVSVPPAKAATCAIFALKPVKVSNGTRVRFRAYAECIPNAVKGLRVHIEGSRDGVEINNNDPYINDNTCGGPTHQPTIMRCPATGNFAISSPLASGTHTYETFAVLDAVWGGQAFWSLEQDADLSDPAHLSPG